MKYHTLFLSKIRKMLQNLLSAAVVIGALRVKVALKFENIVCCKILVFALRVKHGMGELQ